MEEWTEVKRTGRDVVKKDKEIRKSKESLEVGEKDRRGGRGEGGLKVWATRR